MFFIGEQVSHNIGCYERLGGFFLSSVLSGEIERERERERERKILEREKGR